MESEAKRLLVAQETLQDSLDQALTVNQHSVDDALSVDRFLQVAQTDVEELRGHLYVKDKAQIELIQQVSRCLLEQSAISRLDPRNAVQRSDISLR